jgi:serine/threonine-protein kinase
MSGVFPERRAARRAQLEAACARVLRAREAVLEAEGAAGSDAPPASGFRPSKPENGLWTSEQRSPASDGGAEVAGASSVIVTPMPELGPCHLERESLLPFAMMEAGPLPRAGARSETRELALVVARQLPVPAAIERTRPGAFWLPLAALLLLGVATVIGYRLHITRTEPRANVVPAAASVAPDGNLPVAPAPPTEARPRARAVSVPAPKGIDGPLEPKAPDLPAAASDPAPSSEPAGVAERAEAAAVSPASALVASNGRNIVAARAERVLAAVGDRARSPSTPAALPPASRPGYLTLDTTPWSSVSLGKVSLGQTPLVRVEVPAGRYELALQNEELGIASSVVVDIVSGETTVRRIGLEGPVRAAQR